MVHLVQAKSVIIIATNTPQKLPEYLSDEAILKNRAGNTGKIYIGGENVDALSNGYTLEIGESTDPIHVPLLSEIFIYGTKGDRLDIFIYDNPVIDALDEMLTHLAGLKGTFISPVVK